MDTSTSMISPFLRDLQPPNYVISQFVLLVVNLSLNECNLFNLFPRHPNTNLCLPSQLMWHITCNVISFEGVGNDEYFAHLLVTSNTF